MIKSLIKSAMSASRKLGWIVFGEMWAPFAALDCWLQCRPLHVCEECDEWMPRWHYHAPGNYNTPENRRSLMLAMYEFPELGRSMIDILRDDDDFAEFLVQKYHLPEKPKIEPKYPPPLDSKINEAMIDPTFRKLWDEAN